MTDDPQTCPHGDHPLTTAARVGTVAVCGQCGGSVNFNIDGTVRRAYASDTEQLLPGDRAMLLKARSAIVRPRR